MSKHHPNQLSDEDKTKIIELHNKFPEKDAKRLWKLNLLNYSYYQILSVFKDRGIKINTARGGGYNKKEVFNFLESLDDTSYYWIGYIAADGNLSTRLYNVSLTSKDKEILVEFRNVLRQPSLALHKRTGVDVYTIIFSDKTIYEALFNLGITPRKSMTLKYTGEINWNFIRGYFDGNGYVSKNGNRCKFTTGSEELAKQITEFLISEGVDASNIKDDNHFDVYILAKNLNLFKEKLYRNATFCMTRKKERMGVI
mgnify:CR=1 FL=1